MKYIVLFNTETWHALATRSARQRTEESCLSAHFASTDISETYGRVRIVCRRRCRRRRRVSVERIRCIYSSNVIEHKRKACAVRCI